MKHFLQRIVLLLLVTSCAAMSQELIQFDSPETKQRYQALIENMRCLVCQNESLADSSAALAGDLRAEVEKKLRQGSTDQEIIKFMVARYGDFILYEPPLEGKTLLLWFMPALLILFAIVFFILYFGRRPPVTHPVDESRRSRAAQLLRDESDNEQG